MPSPLYALHGNLQTPAVWERFDGMVHGPDGQPLEWRTQDLWADTTQALLTDALAQDKNPFRTWAADFCQRVERETTAAEQKERAADDNRPWLLGYSLGGRLALHALVEQPTLWRGAIIVGADSGLADENAKAARLAHDQHWGERFLSEPWEQLLAEWDAQGVFGGRANARAPREGDFDREKIARLFDAFSKGRQDDLLPELSRLPEPPVLFLAGADDPAYSAVGEKLAAACPTFTFRAAPGAAHRVPWEAPAAFTRAVQDFIGSGHEPTLVV
ncbi:alpha/beta fold hydrolase [Ruficoccus sp. ZRK36]|uniref:alpha/beta fold hydrolase n=1 Tax=Ruficoccus sp. ZRK36 TaxID=2866311 RepID=UPI001C736DB5|nr:alpha/beta fold hydrolase [Ruficoccus sp. ZRK36]QYY34987.1 alpha/beta fold hydrolase [Ruficoccus sp. ZRK36]